jgi:hypothetical protein
MPTANVTGTLLSPIVCLLDGALFNGAIQVERAANGAATRKPASAAV